MQLMEDVKEFIKFYRMMRNFRSVIVMGANAFGDLAVGLRQNYQSYFDAAVAVESYDCLEDVYGEDLSALDNDTLFKLLGNRKVFSAEQCKKLITDPKKHKINENYKMQMQT